MRITPMKILNYLHRLPTLKYPLRTTLALLLQATRLSEYIVIQRKHYRIRFASSSAIARNFWINPDIVIREEQIVNSILSEGATMIDVGANIGTIALSAASIVKANGRVIAIEPHPRTFQNLMRNVELNQFPNVVLYNNLCAANSGVAMFSDIGSDDQNHVSERGIPVNAITLDAIVTAARLTKIDLLKIDVEGYEKEVLKGARNALAITEAIFIETIDKNLNIYNTSTDEIVMFLQSNGYRLFRVNDRREELLALRSPCMDMRLALTDV